MRELLPGVKEHDPHVAHVQVIPSHVDGINRHIRRCNPVYDGCIKDLAAMMTGEKLDPKTCVEKMIIPVFRSHANFTHISMSEVVDLSGSEEGKKKLKSIFNDKYVVVGATDQTLKDVGPTPMDEKEPLVVTHANRIEGIVNNIYITPVKWEVLAAISMALLLIYLLFVKSGRVLFSSSIGFIVLSAAFNMDSIL